MTGDEHNVELLGWELYETRRLVLRMVPIELCKALEHYEVPTIHDWRGFVEPAIIGMASRLEGTERAMCPLCRCGPRVEHGPGFLVPEGLNRHLRGTHRFPRCEVMTVAEELAKHEILKTPRGRAVLT